MADKRRPSAFSLAMQEAQHVKQPQEHLKKADTVEPPPTPTQPLPSAPLTSEEPLSRKGGRPRNLIAKKKFTYYMKDDADEHVTAIRKALVRFTDILVEDKGEVVEQALRFMRFGLEDEASRKAFLALYQRWLGRL